MKRPDEEAEYVEVADESLHAQVFSDEHCRVYRATLAPGQATLYHRHSEDTFYVVLKGGWMATRDLKGHRRCPMIFSRSVSVMRILRLAVQTAFTGSAYLPTGLSFFMPTKKRPSVHKAVASPRNTTEVVLLGIEMRY